MHFLYPNIVVVTHLCQLITKEVKANCNIVTRTSLTTQADIINCFECKSRCAARPSSVISFRSIGQTHSMICAAAFSRYSGLNTLSSGDHRSSGAASRSMLRVGGATSAQLDAASPSRSTAAHNIAADSYRDTGGIKWLRCCCEVQHAFIYLRLKGRADTSG